jgi:hypothetical protein
MKLSNKREIKIFLTFFFIYSFFIHWIGSNENSRFALTRAIVDEGGFEIDSFYNQTGDRSYYNQHYYSDKEPGVSFLAISVYVVWKFVYYNFFPESFIQNHVGSNTTVIDLKVGMNNVPIYLSIKPGFFILSSMILLTIFTSSLLGALLIVLVYKISKYFTNNEKSRLIITFVVGLGTLIFPYSIVFFDHVVYTFFSFFSFYLLFKAKHENINKKRYFIFVGLISGYAIVCGTITFVITLACLAYLLSFNKEKLFYFVIGGIIGLLPLLLYNYSIFGTPFTLPRHHLDPNIWSEYHIQGLHTPNPFVIFRLLIYPFKGLFFYYPILIFSLIGLCYMYKKFKIETVLIIFVFFAYLIFNSAWYAWWGGASFGPRHLTIVTPFLSIPLLYFFIKKGNSTFIKYLIIILSIFSIFINFLGLQYISDEVIDNNSLLLKNEIAQKINTLSIIKNPIFDYYIPRFLEFGPRSPLFENIINGEEPDIRYIFYEKGDAISQFFFYKPFINILPVVLIFIIIWNKKMFTYLISFSKNKFKLFLLIMLIFLCIFLFYILNTKKTPVSSNINFERGWFPIDKYGIKWMRQDGIITYYNNYSQAKLMHVSMISKSYYRDRQLQFFLNNQIISTETIKSENSLKYNFFIKFNPEKNILKLHAIPNCDIGAEVGESNVIDCKSVFLENFTIEQPEDLIYDKNWYEKLAFENVRWMEQNGTIIAINTRDKPVFVKLHFNSTAFNSEKNVEIYVNNRLLDTFIVHLENSNISTSIFSLKSGINSIKLHSLGECKVIGKVIGNDDKRCVTIGLTNISLSYFDYVNDTILFKDNFYPFDYKDGLTFMNQDGLISYITIEPKSIWLNLSVLSFKSNTTLQIYLNDKLINTSAITKNFTDYAVWVVDKNVIKGSDEIHLKLDLNLTNNTIKLHSLKNCTKIGDVLNNDDGRCVTIGIVSLKTN